MKLIKGSKIELQKNLYDSNYAYAYSNTFDSNKRLTRERNFYRKLFRKYKLKTILDVGCGDGFHLNLFKSLNGVKKIVGVDSSEKMVSIANVAVNDHKQNKVEIVIKKANSYELSRSFTDKFDLVTCIYGLSAIPSEKLILQSLRGFKKCLNNKGILLVEDINGDRIIEHPKLIQYRTIEKSSYDAVKRNNLVVRIFDGYKVPKFYKSKSKVNIELGFHYLYNFLKQKNIYLKIYHNLDPNLLVDIVFINQGLLKRVDIEYYRNHGWLLPNERLLKYLKIAGFSKITTYGNHKMSALKSNSYGQIVIAQ